MFRAQLCITKKFTVRLLTFSICIVGCVRCKTLKYRHRTFTGPVILKVGQSVVRLLDVC